MQTYNSFGELVAWQMTQSDMTGFHTGVSPMSVFNDRATNVLVENVIYKINQGRDPLDDEENAVLEKAQQQMNKIEDAYVTELREQRKYEENVRKFGGDPYQRKQEHEATLQRLGQQFLAQKEHFEAQANGALYFISDVPELRRLVNDTYADD